MVVVVLLSILNGAEHKRFVVGAFDARIKRQYLVRAKIRNKNPEKYFQNKRGCHKKYVSRPMETIHSVDSCFSGSFEQSVVLPDVVINEKPSSVKNTFQSIAKSIAIKWIKNWYFGDFTIKFKDSEDCLYVHDLLRSKVLKFKGWCDINLFVKENGDILLQPLNRDKLELVKECMIWFLS